MFRFLVSELSEFVTAVGNAMGRKRSALPILDSVLVEMRADGVVWVSAFNFDVGVEAVLPSAQGIVRDTEVGRMLLPIAELRAALAAGKAGDRLTLTPSEQGRAAVEIRPGFGDPRLRAELELLPLEEYPAEYAAGEFVESVTVPARAFRTAVAATAPGLSTDDMFPMLQGFQLWLRDGDVRLRATDRFRVHDIQVAASIDGDLAGDWLMPGKPLAKAARWLVGGTPAKPDAEAVEIGTIGRDGVLAIRASGRILHMRLLGHDFPRINSLFGHETGAEFTVDPQALADAVKPHKSRRRIVLELDDAGLALTSDLGTARVATTAHDAGDTGRVMAAFVPEHLADTARVLPKGAAVTVSLRRDSVSSRPVLFTFDGGRVLLMSVRMPDGATTAREAVAA